MDFATHLLLLLCVYFVPIRMYLPPRESVVLMTHTHAHVDGGRIKWDCSKID